MSKWWVAALLACATCLVPAVAHAQEPALAGRVIAADSASVRDARILATDEGGRTYEARTDSAGRYRIPLAAGAYVVSAEGPGLRSAARVVKVAARGETRTDFRLDRRVAVLEEIVVRVPRLSVEEATRWTPGSVTEGRLGRGLRNEPLGADAVADLAARQVGVSVAPNGAGISMLGQAPGQTRSTVDGADQGAGTVPREAVSAVEVHTQSFDVARGGFTGGQVNVRTQPAGNDWGATLRLERSDPRLQYGTVPGGSRGRTGLAGLDASAGGAVVRDRVFVLGAVATRGAWSPRLSLTDLGSWEREQLGLTPDTLHRFLGLTAEARPRVPTSTDPVAGFASGLVRIDAVLSPRHSLTVQASGRRSVEPDAGTVDAVPGTGNEGRGSGSAFLARLGSGGSRVANELRVQGSRAEWRWTAADPVPEGVVVLHPSSGGVAGPLPVRFAGSPAVRGSRENGFEVADQLVVTTADRRHRLRVGAEGAVREHLWHPATDPGAFHFESLDALEENRPALFTRTLDPAEQRLRVGRSALFADDLWRAGRLDLSFGFRAERTVFGSDLATEAIPARWRVSPRFGFGFETRMPWNRPAERTFVQGGVGEFVGVLPAAMLGAALAETGEADTRELVCAGPAAPRPEWAAYRADPGAAPRACADGSSPFASRLPRTTLVAPGFGPPRALRAAIHGEGVARGAFWSLSLSALRGTNQPIAFDRNLVEGPRFRIEGEGGRPVHVGPEAIDPATGVTSILASRRVPEDGIARELTGVGRSRALQATARVGTFLGPLEAEAGYTWLDARETVGAFGGLGGMPGSTAGDPSRVDRAAAPYAPRHSVYFYAEWWRSRFARLGLTGNLASGRPFTPRVAGDVNGDGVPNDRAFVFAPHDGGAEESVRRAMDRLLDSGPDRVRSCLRAQLGRIAAHNSCRSGWRTSLDLNARIELGPRIEGRQDRRLTLWVVAANVPAGLDYLLHGPEKLRGWGQEPVIDEALLQVRGFDPDARAFRYEVNPRFGRSVAGSAVARSGFTISVQGRLAVGSDRVVAHFRRMVTASGGSAVLNPAELRQHLERQLVNLPAEALAESGPSALALVPAQARALARAADSLAVEREALVAELREAVGGSTEGVRDVRRIRALVDSANGWRAAARETTRAILTPEQWARLPRSLRDPPPGFSPLPPRRLVAPQDY